MRDLILASWSLDLALVAPLVIMALLYLRGAARWRGASAGRIACYLGGLGAIALALGSPVEAFAPLMLSAHMVQHMLLTMVAAPLILLGEPFVPLLRGLPRWLRQGWVAPLISTPSVRRAGRWLVHPVVAWCAFNIVFVSWHVPVLYELALRDPAWHRVEHLSLLGGAILLWWPVVQPRPSRALWPRWAMVPYLLAADIVNTIVSATFAFAPRPIYATYEATAPALGIDALRDQAAAGALMWVPGSVAYLVPAAVILVRQMRPKFLRTENPGRSSTGTGASARSAPKHPAATPANAVKAISLPQLGVPGRSAARFDLLRAPVIGPWLSRRWFRVSLRGVMLALAAVIVLDGFLGPQEAPMNLAGTLPWTHWRGMAVVLLLVGGNFLCMTCPFVLPRMAADRWRRRRGRWSGASVVLGTALGAIPSAAQRVAGSPLVRQMRSRAPRLLRRKWLAVGIVAIWLVVYEAFDLWASPLATAWLIVAYFIAAFVVDSLGRSGSFCKAICPLGQFHFAQSTVAPLTVAVREPAVCTQCATHDCLRGNERRSGCGLDLFVPRKIGNLDCTFCLDCADACPSGNIGILSRSVASELESDRWRSSLGRLSRRMDLAVLLLLLSVGAVVNAAGMTAPALERIVWLAERLGGSRPASAALIVALMVAIPMVAVVLISAAARGRRWREAFIAIAIATVPLGAAVWLVHFSFHFVTSWQTAGPVIVRAANDLGVTAAQPGWSAACCTHAPDWLLPANLLALSIGTALSLRTLAWRWAGPAPHIARSAGRREAAQEPSGSQRDPWRRSAWSLGALFIVALWAAAAWVLFQPMDMRGTMGFEVLP